MSHTILMFLKFGSESHVQDLYENGTIYMNPIQKFREIEDDQLIGDKYESATEIWNFPSGKFEIPSIGYKGNYISLHVRGSYEGILGNIYSLYCISSYGFSDPNSFYIDEKMKRFGSHFLMIKDNPRFLELVTGKLNLLGLKLYHGFVEYYDKKLFNGQINLFQKPNEFEYQKEFRIYADTLSLEPVVFKIGSLKNIAEMHRTDHINELKLIKGRNGNIINSVL